MQREKLVLSTEWCDLSVESTGNKEELLQITIKTKNKENENNALLHWWTQSHYNTNPGEESLTRDGRCGWRVEEGSWRCIDWVPLIVYNREIQELKTKELRRCLSRQGKNKILWLWQMEGRRESDGQSGIKTRGGVLMLSVGSEYPKTPDDLESPWEL